MPVANDLAASLRIIHIRHRKQGSSFGLSERRRRPVPVFARLPSLCSQYSIWKMMSPDSGFCSLQDDSLTAGRHEQCAVN